MAKACEICGKTTIVGNRIVRHGLAKSKGGIGLHTTGITRRTFKPNLLKIKVNEKGHILRRVVCTQSIKAGKVIKA